MLSSQMLRNLLYIGMAAVVGGLAMVSSPLIAGPCYTLITEDCVANIPCPECLPPNTSQNEITSHFRDVCDDIDEGALNCHRRFPANKTTCYFVATCYATNDPCPEDPENPNLRGTDTIEPDDPERFDFHDHIDGSCPE